MHLAYQNPKKNYYFIRDFIFTIQENRNLNCGFPKFNVEY